MRKFTILRHIFLFYFTLMGLFHFIRLALNWDLVIIRGEEVYSIHTLGSALYFLFSILVVYLIIKAKKEDKKIEISTEEEKEFKEEEE